MADYDPKRRRPRQPTAADEPAAVDALLDAAAHAAAPQPGPSAVEQEPEAVEVPSKVPPAWDQASWADAERPLSPMVSGGVDSGAAADDRAVSAGPGSGAQRRVVMLAAVIAGVLVLLVMLRRRRR